MSLDSKHHQLRRLIASSGSATVAFSGGVDSTLLLKVCADVLGPAQVLALTATAAIIPQVEIDLCCQLAADLGVRHQLIPVAPLQLASFKTNPADRCYHCKQHIFQSLLKLIENEGKTLLFDGSNQDDLAEYRPGHRALRELQIRSPLQEAALTKREVRQLSRQLGLPNWDKPSFACLATRFPYGTPITPELLTRVDRCEDWLRQHQFRIFRVRCHEQLARVEVGAEEMSRLLDAELRRELVRIFRENGFDYVTLDLQGYRSGSMDEVLPEDS